MVLVVLNPVGDERRPFFSFLYKHLFVIPVRTNQVKKANELAGASLAVAGY